MFGMQSMGITVSVRVYMRENIWCVMMLCVCVWGGGV